MEKLNTILQKPINIWVIFIIWVLFITNLWLPRNWGFYGNSDWDLTYSTFEVARQSIVEFGEWPNYQAFLAFGSDLNANPQAVHISIFFIPVLILGTFYGYKVSIIIAILIGLWGAFKLFKLYQFDKIIAFGMSFIWVAAPYFSRHIFEAGHSNFLFFYFLPWIIFQFERYRKENTIYRLIYFTLLMAMPIAGGAPIFVIIAAFAAVSLLTFYTLKHQANKQFTINICIGIFTSIALNAWKILPAMDLWEQTPRLSNDESGINLLTFLQSIVDFKTDTQTPHQWHEITIGFPLVLIGLSLYQITKLENWKFYIFCMIPILWIGLGNTPQQFNPWYVLNHYLPVFNSLRAPFRISILTLTFLSILFLKTVNYYQDKKLIYIILISCIVSQTLSYKSISTDLVFTPRIDEIFIQPELKKQSIVRLNKEEKLKQFAYIQKQCFVQNAYEPLNLLEVKDSCDNFLIGAKLIQFKPSKIKLITNDTIVKIGLRYSPYWHLIGKGKIVNQNGLLVLKNPETQIELEYGNPHTKNGLFIAALAIIIFGFYIWILNSRAIKSQ